MVKYIMACHKRPIRVKMRSLRQKILRTLPGCIECKTSAHSGNVITAVGGTFRLVEALQKANKDFDMICLPNMTHQMTSYTIRREWDYLVTHLQGIEPPKEFSLTIGEFLVEERPEPGKCGIYGDGGRYLRRKRTCLKIRPGVPVYSRTFYSSFTAIPKRHPPSCPLNRPAHFFVLSNVIYYKDCSYGITKSSLRCSHR